MVSQIPDLKSEYLRYYFDYWSLRSHLLRCIQVALKSVKSAFPEWAKFLILLKNYILDITLTAINQIPDILSQEIVNLLPIITEDLYPDLTQLSIENLHKLICEFKQSVILSFSEKITKELFTLSPWLTENIQQVIQKQEILGIKHENTQVYFTLIVKLSIEYNNERKKLVIRKLEIIPWLNAEHEATRSPLV